MNSLLRVVISACLACAIMMDAVRADTFAIIGGRIHTMQSREPIDNAAILISDDQIVAVGSNLDLPDGVTIIDATGKVITPSFMNSATQLGLVEISAVEETNDHSVSAGPLGAAFDIQYAINSQSELIRQARADGLSRAITYPGNTAMSPFAGLGALLRLIPGSTVLEKPRIALFVEIGGQSSAGSGGSRSAQWVLLRNSLDEATSHRPSRRPLGHRDSFLERLDLDTLKDVTDGILPLVIDTNRESDIRQAIVLARDYEIQVIIKGGIEAWAVADELAAANIPVILDPSINIPLYFDYLNARSDNGAILDEAGVTIAFKVSSIHTSFNAGFSLREVAGLAVSNGLDYHAALKALTVNAAKIWGLENRYGVLAAGRDADLVIWDGDPFEPASAPVAVFIRGQQVSLNTRQTELRDRYLPDVLDLKQTHP